MNELTHINGVYQHNGAFCHAIDLSHLGRPDMENPRAPLAGQDETRLDQVGWGIIVPEDIDPSIMLGLSTLLDLRRRQTRNPKLYRELYYRPGETVRDFLIRNDAPDPGEPVNPKVMPYYLTIVGSPDKISFSFQKQLASDYAVGRIHFDFIHDFEVYARAVQAAAAIEDLPRRLGIFGVQNGENLTNLCRQHMVEPLIHTMSQDYSREAEARLGAEANKAALLEMMAGNTRPDLLVTASHGLCLRQGAPAQKRVQGSLICSEWHGVPGKGLTTEHYIHHDDIQHGAPPMGQVSLHFACFSAGTPKVAEEGLPESETLGAESFVSQLAQQRLAHPNGPSLAFIGYAERAWEQAFFRGRSQINAFAAVIAELMDGRPVGHATRYFTRRRQALSEQIYRAQEQDKTELAIAYHDARSIVVLGDPAVCVGGFR